MTYKLVDFVTEFADELAKQLAEDEARWGDTWRHRPIEGQEERTYARFRDYFDQYLHTGAPVPWLKIAGNALICWVRERYPEELENG